jgi:Co/Zn/Cd efflux system component
MICLPASSDFKRLIKHEMLAVHGIIVVPENLCDTPVDFLEDTSVNLLIFFALAWTARSRARVGMGMAFVMLVPVLAFLWTAWAKFMNPILPEAFALSVTGLGALVVNLFCAYLLAAYRHTQASLTRAASLSAP